MRAPCQSFSSSWFDKVIIISKRINRTLHQYVDVRVWACACVCLCESAAETMAVFLLHTYLLSDILLLVHEKKKAKGHVHFMQQTKENAIFDHFLRRYLIRVMFRQISSLYARTHTHIYKFTSKLKHTHLPSHFVWTIHHAKSNSGSEISSWVAHCGRVWAPRIDASYADQRQREVWVVLEAVAADVFA